MPDFVVSVGIEATNNTSPAFSAAANSVEDLAQRSGLAAGDLNIFKAVLEGAAASGQPLSEALKDLSISAASVGGSVAAAAKSLLEEGEAAAAATPEIAENTAATNENTAAKETAGAVIPAASRTISEGLQLEIASYRELAVVSRSAGAGQIASVSLAAGRFGALAGAAVAAAGVVHLANATKEEVLQLERLSSASGVSVSQLAELKATMAEAGAPTENLGQTITRLSRAMEGARDPSSKQAEVFRELGVSTAGWAQQLPPAMQVLSDVAAHLSNSTNSTQDAANVSQVFGRNVVGLTGFLKDQGSSLQQNMANFRDYGQAMEDAGGPARDLEKIEADLNRSFRELGAEILPAVNIAAKATVETFEFLAVGAAEAANLVEASFASTWAEIKTGSKVAADLASGNIGKAALDIADGAETAKKDWTDFWNTTEQLGKNYLDEFDSRWKSSALGKKPSGDSNTDYEKVHKPSNKADEEAITGAMQHQERLSAAERDGIESRGKLNNESEGMIAAQQNASYERELAALESFLDRKAALAEKDRANDGGAKAQAVANERVALQDRTNASIQKNNEKAAAEGHKLDQQADAIFEESQIHMAKAAEKTSDAAGKAAGKLDEATIKASDRRINEQNRADEITESASIAHQSRMYDVEKSRLDAEVAAGRITVQQKIAQLKSIEEAEFKLAMASAAKNLATANKPNPATGEVDPSKVAKANADIEGLADKHNKKMAELAAQGAAAAYAPYKKIYEQVSGDFNRGITSWATGEEKFGRAMQQVWRGIESQAISSILKIGEKWVEQHVIMAIAAKVLGDSGQDTSKYIAQNVQKAQSDAGVAAAEEFMFALADSGGDLAYATEMAAAALAIGTGFAATASAEGGWDLPAFSGGAPAVLHSKEMVLPREHADTIRRLGGEGGGNTSSTTNHIYNAPPGASPHDAVAGAASFKRAMRDGRVRL